MSDVASGAPPPPRADLTGAAREPAPGVDFGPPPRPSPPPPPPSSPPPRPSLAERVRSAPITFLLAAVNVAVFLWAESHGSTLDVGTLLRFGAVERVHVWAGEYYRLATCMFMHIGWMHIALNTYFGVGWCMPVERRLGGWRFLAVYLLAGVGGGCASVLPVGQAMVSAGASGALFGIVGAVLAIRRRQLGTFRAFFSDRGIRTTLLSIGIWIVIGETAIKMDNRAHLGGFAVGAIITWVVTSKRPALGWAAFAVGFAGLVFAAARPGWQPAGEDRERLAVFAHVWLFGEPSEGFTKDTARGTRFAELACDAGAASACVDLAATRVEDDPAGAAALFQRACEAGQPDGCAGEGVARALGEGLPRDEARGRQMVDDACKKGSAWACKVAPTLPR